jgi:hypothetical protein
MTIRERWKKTSLPNQLLVIIGLMASLFTGLYALATIVQICLMRQAAADATAQMNRVICEAKRIAASNENALAANAEQSKSALDASIKSSQLDQRAWIGLAEYLSVTSPQSGSSMNGVRIAIRNSGKTPAINLSVDSLRTFRPLDQPIGDYDSLATQGRVARDEAKRKFDADTIRRNPKMAAVIEKMNQEDRALERRYEHPLAGQVIAPKVILTFLNPEVTNLNPGTPVTYILGKITYNDVFAGTKQHTTKFCLMRSSGTEFVSCQTGNSMD